MSINNSFSIMSYNLGGGSEDYELLLSSFHVPLNEYMTLKWESFGGNPAIGLKEAELARNDFYLNALIFDEVLKSNSGFKKEWESFAKEKNSDERFELLQGFIDNRPELKQKISEFRLSLLDRACELEPRFGDFVKGKIGNSNAETARQIKENLLTDEHIRRAVANVFLSELRNNAETNATREVMKNPCDVIFLQEVAKPDRIFMSELKTKNYAIEYLSSSYGFDTAVALNTSRFDKIKNYSVPISTGEVKKDCAICVANDKETGKRFMFISAHIPGFDYKLTDKELAEQAKNGDTLSINLLKKIKEIKNAEKEAGTPIDATIIGSDVNASPEKLSSRFKIFEKKKFSVKRTGSPTNVHFMDANDKAREIDYFFSRVKGKSLKERIKRVFLGGEKIKINPASFPGFGFDMESNMSDHKPIVGVVTVITKNSLKVKFRNLIRSFTKFLRRGKTTNKTETNLSSDSAKKKTISDKK